MKIAILNDYQNVSLKMADWSLIPGNPEIKVFNDHETDFESLIQRLLPFDILCVMRERTPLTTAVLERLPNLKLICSTGARNASINIEEATRRGITVLHTGYESTPTIEFVWAMILGIARNIAAENASLRAGGWQTSIGTDLKGKILGVLGLGNIGTPVAQIGRAFGMRVVAWSPNLTREKANAAGVEFVSKEDLFRNSDFLTVHMVLSSTTRGIVGLEDLNRMKSSSYLINTSRGPLVDEKSLIEVLEKNKIAGAAVDVYETEPLPADHIFRSLKNVLATPHLGFVTESLYETFYRDTVSNICNWINK
jgi:phosphoglycerate dehydrogenase-like enzyme